MAKNLLIFLSIILYVSSYSQSFEGKVIDEYSNPLIGATIFVYDQNNKLVNGTTADEQGLFFFSKGSEIKKIKVSYTGYKTKELPVEDISKPLTIKLKQNIFVSEQILIKGLPYHYFSQDTPGKLTIKGKHPGLAATFDDPSRALLRTPASTLNNDQSNGIIFRGLPSHFIKWEMNGTEILNPNHLTNAGTLSDLGSASSGGVLSIPFDFLDEYIFYPAPFNVSRSNALAGISNLVPVQNFKDKSGKIKIGLLGLEGAFSIYNEKAKSFGLHGLYARYRYSTVGLLSDLGISFNGEEIRFQDANLGAEIFKSKNDNIKFWINVGRSENSRRPTQTIDLAESFFDVSENFYKNDILISGLHWERKIKPGVKLDQNVFFSAKKEQKQSRIDTTGNAEYVLLDTYQDESKKWAYRIERTRTFLNIFSYKFGADLIYDHISVGQRRTENDAFLATNQWRARPFAGYNFKLWRIQTNASTAIHYSSLIERPAFEFSLLASYSQKNGTLAAEISRQSQLPANLILLKMAELGASRILFAKSINTSLSYSYKAANWDRLFKFRIRGFYHFLRDIPSFNNYSTINGIPPFYPMTLDQMNYENHSIIGYDITLDVEPFSGWFINANFSQFDFLDSENEYYKYSYQYVFNGMLTKRLSLFKKMDVFLSLAQHSRSGNTELLFDEERSNYSLLQYSDSVVTLSNFSRLDFRISATFGKSRKNLLELDIQNLTNRQNDSYYIFDPVFSRNHLVSEQGLVPLLSYTRKF